MDLGNIPLFKAMMSRMSWLTERQQVLAQNVANADTPGYAARDMKPMDFAALVSQSQAAALATTDPRHIGVGGGTNGAAESMRAADAEGTPSGNAVSLEEEMIKLSDTQVQYQAVTNLYAKAMGMFRIALGVRQ
jgi:flagellar basal-body rod protein FlgB